MKPKRAAMKRCPDHTHCYDKCKSCGHCDTSYEDNPKLLCPCLHCLCGEWTRHG